MTLCIHCRHGMSVFRALYDFVERDPPPRRLNRVEKQEVLNFIGIVPLLFSDIRRPWSSILTATDASPDGFGVCEREASADTVSSLGEWNERWRFRRLPPEQWGPRQRALGLDVLSDTRSVGGCGRGVEQSGMYVDNHDFTGVASHC